MLGLPGLLVSYDLQFLGGSWRLLLLSLMSPSPCWGLSSQALGPDTVLVPKALHHVGITSFSYSSSVWALISGIGRCRCGNLIFSATCVYLRFCVLIWSEAFPPLLPYLLWPPRFPSDLASFASALPLGSSRFFRSRLSCWLLLLALPFSGLFGLFLSTFSLSRTLPGLPSIFLLQT